jgi:acyl carrier protein
MSREDIVNTILIRLSDVCKMKGIVERGFDESTVLIGSETAVLDSLGLVMLIVQIEESLDASRGSPTVLVQRLFAEETAAETVGTLADRCLAIIGDRK